MCLVLRFLALWILRFVRFSYIDWYTSVADVSACREVDENECELVHREGLGARQ